MSCHTFFFSGNKISERILVGLVLSYLIQVDMLPVKYIGKSLLEDVVV